MKRAQRRCAPRIQRRHSRWRTIAMQPRAHCALGHTGQRPKPACGAGRGAEACPHCRKGSHSSTASAQGHAACPAPCPLPGSRHGACALSVASARGEHRNWPRPDCRTCHGTARPTAPLPRRKWRMSSRQHVIVEGDVVHHARIRRATRAGSRWRRCSPCMQNKCIIPGRRVSRLRQQQQLLLLLLFQPMHLLLQLQQRPALQRPALLLELLPLPRNLQLQLGPARHLCRRLRRCTAAVACSRAGACSAPVIPWPFRLCQRRWLRGCSFPSRMRRQLISRR